MAIALVTGGTVENSTTGATSLAVTLPTLLQDDVVYLFVIAEGGTLPTTTVSGYTELINVTNGFYRFGVYRKKQTATPDTSVTASFSISCAAAAVAICLRGVDTTTPEDATTVTAGWTTSANPDSPSITTITDNAWVLSAFGNQNSDTTVTAPTGYSNQVDRNSAGADGMTVGVASKLVATAGAENPAAWTNVQSAIWYAVSVAVRPSTGGGAQGLTATLYADGETFFTPVVSVGAVALAPALYVDPDTFFVPELVTVTWDPVNKGSGIVLSNFNRTATGTSFGWSTARATIGKATGKWYWECVTSGGSASKPITGLVGAATALSGTFPGNSAPGAGMADSASYVTTWTKSDTAVFTVAANDVFMFALDVGAGKLWVGKNGSWLSASDPAAGTGQWVSNITGTVYPAGGAFASDNNIRLRTNLGEFSHSVPSGFLPYASAGVSDQGISPDLFANTNTFFVPVVTRGAVTLTPILFADPDTFFTAIVSAGAVTLAPALFIDGDTFYVPVVASGAVNLTPTLHVDPDTFFAQVVTAGAVDLAPTVFVDADTFYSPALSLTLTAAQYVDADTFFTQAITTAYAISASSFADPDTFFIPVVSSGALTLAPALYIDADTFYTHSVGASGALFPDLYVDDDIFFSSSVAAGAVDLAPALYANTNTFYSHVVGGLLQPTLFVDPDTFYAHSVATGEVLLAPTLYIDADTFYAHALVSLSSLGPTLFLDADNFYTHDVYQFLGIRPDIYVDGDTFYSVLIEGGAVDIQPPLLIDPDIFYGHRIGAPTKLRSSRGSVFAETSTVRSQPRDVRSNDAAKTRRP